jgi:hypothetical protein
MKIEPTIELRIKSGFFLKLFQFIIAVKKDDWNISFFKIHKEKSKGFVYYKLHNKLRWKCRCYDHNTINHNIKEGYSMGGWYF